MLYIYLAILAAIIIAAFTLNPMTLLLLFPFVALAIF